MHYAENPGGAIRYIGYMCGAKGKDFSVVLVVLAILVINRVSFSSLVLNWDVS